MSKKNINVLMSLQDKFSAPLKKVQNLTGQAKKEFKQASNIISNFGESANETFKSLASSVATFSAGLATMAIGSATAGITALAHESMNLANIQTSAETSLGEMIGKVESIAKGGEKAVKSATDSLKNYAKELQNAGVYSDELIMSGMSQMAVFGLNEKQIKQLSGAMVDLLAKYEGYEADANAFRDMGKQIGEAMQGNAGAFEENGIFLSEAQKELIETGTQEQRLALITEVLTEKVGGMNEALAKTDAGKQANALNRLKTSAENLGKKLAPLKSALMSTLADAMPKIEKAITPVIDKLSKAFTDAMPSIEAFISNFADKLPSIIEKAGTVFSAIGNALSAVFSIGSTLLPVILGLVAGFTAFNVISSVASAFSTLKTVMTGVSVAGGILNAVMAMNPIALVAIGVGALVAVLVSAYNNSEKFRTAVQNLWTKLQELGSMVTEKLAPILSTAWEGIKIAFSALAQTLGDHIANILDAFGGIIDFITGVFTGDWNKAWNGIKTSFKSTFEAIKDIALAPLRTITNAIDKIKEKVGNIKMPKLFGGDADHNATGTSYFKGGLTYVNEGNRGELINLPSGSQIIPHDASVKALKQSTPSISISLTVQGNVIGNEAFADQIGEHIARKVTLALGNV